MQHHERAHYLASLHVKGKPLVLYNAWDAGSARAVAAAGALAIGTSSWALAAANAYEDGECMPAEFADQLIRRIVGAVELPVTVDAEGAYSDDPEAGARYIARLLDSGVVGINFEDRVVNGNGLHPIERQCRRIEAIRSMADARGVPLFINARTDLFFAEGIGPADLLHEACARAEAYARAGASGFFVPGLVDLGVIGKLCADIALPLNVMVMAALPEPAAMARVGVARISYGPSPYIQAMNKVQIAAQEAFA